jgi:hypothetical protein
MRAWWFKQHVLSIHFQFLVPNFVCIRHKRCTTRAVLLQTMKQFFSHNLYYRALYRKGCASVVE